MRWLLIGIGILVFLLIISSVVFFAFSPSVDLKQFENLKEPAISKKTNQKVLQIELKGDPNKVGAEAFKKLFSTFYKLKRSEKNMSIQAPKARWSQSLGAKKSEWTGFYAIQIPDNITKLPEGTNKEGPKIKIVEWEYGEVAEILHIGSYASEEPTIKKLKKFIEEKGYEICGDHEEEYLKGPGMFFKGNPDKYYTIIRYRVKQKGDKKQD